MNTEIGVDVYTASNLQLMLNEVKIVYSSVFVFLQSNIVVHTTVLTSIGV